MKYQSINMRIEIAINAKYRRRTIPKLDNFLRIVILQIC